MFSFSDQYYCYLNNSNSDVSTCSGCLNPWDECDHWYHGDHGGNHQRTLRLPGPVHSGYGSIGGVSTLRIWNQYLFLQKSETHPDAAPQFSGGARDDICDSRGSLRTQKPLLCLSAPGLLHEDSTPIPLCSKHKQCLSRWRQQYGCRSGHQVLFQTAASVSLVLFWHCGSRISWQHCRKSDPMEYCS